MPTGVLLVNVASLSMCLGALAALAILFVYLRARPLLPLLAFVLILSVDYLLGLLVFAPVGSPLWLGMAGIPEFGRTDTVFIGLKGLCQAGILLTAPAAALGLLGDGPSRAAAAVGASVAALTAVSSAFLIAGILPSLRTVWILVAGVPGALAYGYCVFAVFRRRRRVEGRLSRGILRTFLLCAAVLTPSLLVDDILAFFGGGHRASFTDPLAFLALTGGILVCSLLFLVDGNRRRPAASDLDAFCELKGLSLRERDVIRLLAEGLRYKQIAQRLCISQDTVKTHVSRIYRKTSSTGRTDLFYRIRLGKT